MGIHLPDDAIFVQIPAYRDRELGPTLIDLYDKAADPQRLRVSVLWQRSAAEHLPDVVMSLPRLDLIQIDYQQSRGCNWARSVVQKRWAGERYTLLIDSHHRFAENWDATLINMHSELMRQGVSRPLITAYMPRYEPARDPEDRQTCPYRIYPNGYEDGLLIHLTSYVMTDDALAPVRADFASGHFIFGEGEFNAAVPMDPSLYFTGDEVAISLRAFTHGYDLFHPHVVIGWHQYDRSTRVPHWDDHPTWWARHRRSLHRMRRLFSGQLHGRFGSGVVRSVAEFQSRLLLPLIDDGAPRHV